MYGETAFVRFLGCLMIGLMPDEGLDEALSSLRDMLEFYGQKPAGIHHTPQIPQTINARIIEQKKRPDLVITP